ncbi:hypothetical protein V5738_10850 [Salinisphaera sp. SPP-AMP-43]|uniref:hypothetical protein n=1 Tax=Salinisphaera sp. SPP-AMP-43 TaxID=3121288 RepID=UPI003C6DFDE5
MRLTIEQFAGMVPRAAARLLNASQAQVARNARLESGDIETWRGLAHVHNLANPASTSIYRFAGQYWFEWTGVVDVARGPIPGDASERTYFTGAGQPKFTDNELAISGDRYPAVAYDLGLPVPGSSAGVSPSGEAEDDDPALIETRAYTYTYVSKYGEESAPAPASDLVDVAPGQAVDVSGFSVPSGQFVVDTIRIYRTATSGSSTIYEFVDEIAATASSYSDTVDTDALGEQLETDDWIPPPEDMHSLVSLPNGMLAGASGQDICVCEQYVPHAWPDAYRHTADATVVALGVIDNALIVLTDREPYVLTGSSPASMTMTKIGTADFACVSKRGVADVPGVGVIFPTANGLAGVTTSGTGNLTEQYLTREQWHAYNPATMIGLAHRGRYFGFQDGGCLVYDPANQSLYELDQAIAGGYRDPETDTLYLIVGGEIMAWDGGDDAFGDYRWHSKQFQLPAPRALSVARVRAAEYENVRLAVIADGQQIDSVRVYGPQPFRIPIRRRARYYELVVAGTSRVYRVDLAESQDDI